MRAYQTYNSTPIRPAQLAILTGTGSRTGMRGCGLGMVDPISVITGIGKVTDGLRDLFAGLIGSGNRDVHIPAQQETTQAFADILDIIEDACKTGWVTQRVIDDGIAGIKRAMDDFRSMVNQCVREGQCHADRANRGVAEEQALADTIIRDLRAGFVRDCQFQIGTGNGTSNGGGVLPGAGGGASSMLPVGLMAAAAYFLFGR